MIAPALAQIPSGNYAPNEAVNAIDWPPLPITQGGAFQSAHLAPFFGELSPDGAVHRGGKAFLVQSAPFHATVLELSTTGVLDIAPVEPSHAYEAWGLAMANASGVELYQHPGPVSTIASTSAWQGLSCLRAADLDGAGMGDLVGAKGSDFATLTHDGTGWTASATFSALGTILDVQAVNWDGVNEEEIGILTTAGVEVRNGSGTLLAFFAGPATEGLLAAIPPMEGFTTGRLAWAYPHNGDELLLICDYGGSREDCGAFAYAPATLASAVYKDASGARRVDLITGSETDLYMRYFQHQPDDNPPPPPYTPDDDDSKIELGGLYPPSSCRPAFGDITGDNVPDLMLGRHNDDVLYFVGGVKKNVGGIPISSAAPFVLPSRIEDTAGDMWFVTHLSLPTDLTPYTHVKMQLWWSTDGIDLESGAVPGGNAVFELDEMTGDYQPDTGVAADMKVALPLNSGEGCWLTNGYYLTCRLVELDTQNRVVGGSGIVDVSFAYNPDILDEMDPEADSRVALDNNCTGGSGPVEAPAFVLEPRWATLPPPAIATPGALAVNPTMPTYVH
ncbi:MAG: hypothetical protein AAF682_02250 [Planctomycetota bacterium]